MLVCRAAASVALLALLSLHSLSDVPDQYQEKNLALNFGLCRYMSGQECYLDIYPPKTNTDGCGVYQQKTFIGPIWWLEPVSKRSQCLGCAHTCMMGMLAVLLPLPCFSSSLVSSLPVACLSEGYELCCLLSGLVLGCVSA